MAEKPRQKSSSRDGTHRVLDMSPSSAPYGAYGIISQGPGGMVNPSPYSEVDYALIAPSLR